MFLLLFAELALSENDFSPVHLLPYVGGSSHFSRLASLEFVKDIAFILLKKLLVDFLGPPVLVVGSINLGLDHSIAGQWLLNNGSDCSFFSTTAATFLIYLLLLSL